jgi:hypothetical protein
MQEKSVGERFFFGKLCVISNNAARSYWLTSVERLTNSAVIVRLLCGNSAVRAGDLIVRKKMHTHLVQMMHELSRTIICAKYA